MRTYYSYHKNKCSKSWPAKGPADKTPDLSPTLLSQSVRSPTRIYSMALSDMY